MIETMNKLTTIDNRTSKKNKNKLSKQLEQEQNHRNGDHMEGYQKEEGGEEWAKQYRE